MYLNRPYKLLPEDKIKRIVSEPITDFKSKSLVNLIARLQFTLSSQTHGSKLGIAAPQCGVYKQVMIAYGELYINPEWKGTSQKEEIIEGCYSCGEGHTRYKMTRDKYGWAKWQDHTGEWHEEKLNGIKAIVFQHEKAHLDGTIISDVGVLSP